MDQMTVAAAAAMAAATVVDQWVGGPHPALPLLYIFYIYR